MCTWAFRMQGAQLCICVVIKQDGLLDGCASGVPLFGEFICGVICFHFNNI